MSRIGRQPIVIPSAVKVKIEGDRVTVSGPKGELSRQFHRDIDIRLDDGQLLVSRPSDRPEHRSLHGLTRSLLANMVTGVTEGFSKMLELHGVGYRVQMQGQKLVLQVGYSQPVEITPPPEISVTVVGTASTPAGASEGCGHAREATFVRLSQPQAYLCPGDR